MSVFKFLISRTFLINLLLAILFAAIFIWGLFKFIDSYTLHDETISVPQLSGLTVEEVENILTEKDLQYTILDSVYLEKEAKGIVIEQDPEADALVKENRTIYITVTKTVPPKVAMPNVVDASPRIAIAKIESCGLKVGKLEYIPGYCKNCVLGQKLKGKDIEPNRMIDKGTVIDLVIGSGESNQPVVVPYLINLTKEEALSKLQEFYLNIGAELYDDCATQSDSLKARVYSQSPVGGSSSIVNMGSSVDIKLTCDTLRIHFDPSVKDSIISDTINE